MSIEEDTVQYRFHRITDASRDQIEQYVRQKSTKVEKQLATFQDDLITLDTQLTHRDKRYAKRRDASAYDVHLVLYLPGEHLQNIGSTGHGEHWRTAVNEAFEDLEDQLDKLLAKLHRETNVHAYQHRPSWEREGAEQLGEAQFPSREEEDTRWMEEWDERHQEPGSPEDD